MQIHEKSNSNRTSEFQEALISLKTHFGIFLFIMKKHFWKGQTFLKFLNITYASRVWGASKKSLVKVCSTRNNKKITYYNSGK